MEVNAMLDWFRQNPQAIRDDVWLNNHTHVADGKSFVESHTLTIATYGGRPRYKPYYSRLFQYWQICQGTPPAIAPKRADIRMRNNAHVYTESQPPVCNKDRIKHTIVPYEEKDNGGYPG